MLHKFLLSMAVFRMTILIKEVLDVEHIKDRIVYY